MSSSQFPVNPLFSPPPSAKVSPTPVVANGTPGPDILHGSNEADSLSGKDGDDELYGYGGNDRLVGGLGKDLLDGGSGDDVLEDDHGMVMMRGGDGNDQLSSESLGGGLLAGEAGNDRIKGRPGHVLDGGPGDDSIDAFDHPGPLVRTVTVHGGDGNDRVRVLQASAPGFTVVADGGAGRDTYSIEVTSSNGVLKILDFATGEGGDILHLHSLAWSNPFNPVNGLQLVQRGADAVLQKRGANGVPADLIVFVNTAAKDIGNANVSGGYNPDGSSTGRTITGTAAGERLVGGVFADIIRGEGGGDILDGGTGHDQLYGGDGDDRLYGDYPHNVQQVYFAVHPPAPGNDLLDGGNGNDTLVSHWGSDMLRGGAGDDRLVLDAFHGPTPVARVELDGGEGNDRLEVNPWIKAPVEALLTGGPGSDSFVITWSAPNGSLTITDFQAGSGGDLLDIDLGFYWVIPERSPFASGHLRFEQRGADTVVLLDTDGTGGSAQARDFLTLRNVDKNLLVALNMAHGLPPDGTTAGTHWIGRAGDDSWTGGWLDDVGMGGDGNDILDGGPGNDRLVGGAGNDILRDERGDDHLLGGAGDDSLSSTGDDVLEGENGNDTLVNLNGNATLDGGNGDDLLVYQPLLAPFGRARMLGGAGNDIFRIGVERRGSDVATATGGEGSDLFEASTSGYTVTDFQLGAGGDRIMLTTLEQSFSVSLSQGINPFGPASQLRLLQSGADTLLQLDLDGTYDTHRFKTIMTLKGVNADTLTAAHFVEGIDPHATAPTLTPASAAPRNSVGGAGIDYLVGGAGNDRLEAGAGNDTLFGGGGNDLLAGGAGLDTVRYYGGARAYAVTRTTDGFQVTDKRSQGIDGIDTLEGVERIHFHFADYRMALDIDGVAGQAYRLYRAAFDRAPDLKGLGFWINAMDGGVPLNKVAADFVNSTEFRTLYGIAPNNADVVLRLYKNVLHRDPDPEGYAFWLHALDSKSADLPSVLAQFSESPENQKGVAELIANGIVFEPWFG